MKGLAGKTTLGFAQLLVCLGVLLFAPAWSFDFWQAWTYLLIFVTASALITAYLWTKNPQLLERRVNAGPGAEKDKSQKLIQTFASFVFMGLLILPSLDHRFLWSRMPHTFVIAGDALVALGFLAVFLVFKRNSFAAGTIAVAAGQQVIATGPYAIVRHPMYSGALVMLFGTPLALGSWWGTLMLIPMTVVIAVRLLYEEKFLQQRLPGYTEYCRKVRFRLVPFIW